ncbi:MAG: Fic family protein [Lachnospiraceae bacterium]|nr:Fic family protein [Lachnospiraceae bacterium]
MLSSKEISLSIKQQLLEDFRINNRKGLYAITQKIMAYNSNKIEGSTLTSEQTASLFDTGTLVSNGVEVYKAKDIEEMNGHFKMFNEMLKKIDDPLTEELIMSFHYQLKNGVFEDMANGYPIGAYKNKANIVSDIITVPPEDVPMQMKKLIDNYNNSEKKLIDIIEFHAKYESIHPFQDGNGRTGRMIMFKQCINSGEIPIIIQDETKSVYYNALHRAQVDKDYSLLLDYCKECQDLYLERIKVFVDNSIINNKPKLKKK